MRKELVEMDYAELALWKAIKDCITGEEISMNARGFTQSRNINFGRLISNVKSFYLQNGGDSWARIIRENA